MNIVVETTTGTIYRINPTLKLYERLMPALTGELKRQAVGYYEELNWRTGKDGLRLALTCDGPSEIKPTYYILSAPVKKINGDGA